MCRLAFLSLLNIGQIYSGIKMTRGIHLSIEIVLEEVFKLEEEERRIRLEDLLIRMIIECEDLQD